MSVCFLTPPNFRDPFRPSGLSDLYKFSSCENHRQKHPLVAPLLLMRSSSFPIHHFTNSWLMYPLLNTDLCSLLSHTIKSDQDTLQQLHPVTHRIRPLNNFFLKRDILKGEFWEGQTDFQIYLSAFIECSQSGFTNRKLYSTVKKHSLLQNFM